MTGAADNAPETPPPDSPTTPVRHVHVLMVHGVGRHDRFSPLLEIYQALRANLLSPEAPALVEDSIPDWQLERFDEGAAPPFLKIKFRYKAQPGDVAVVYLYEVNYSDLAQVIRANHRLDLTTLFVGFDAAVCSARQQQSGEQAMFFPGNPKKLAHALQRVSGVMAAATGPLLGIPSLALKRYGNSFLTAFTRFFDDVATYALDKSGEQLISEHLDRVVESIRQSDQFANAGPSVRSELMIAAHSLGSIVTHSYLVRHWQDAGLPDKVVTSGSPIGIITWLWLFLDFKNFDFKQWRETETYFCWKPLLNSEGPRRPLSWINVVNCLDPIASAFPDEVVDMSRSAEQLSGDLAAGITHLYCGPAKLSATGRSHIHYSDDRKGFLEILQRAAGLRPGDARSVICTDRATHWRKTFGILGRVRALSWLTAMLFALLYCAIVAWHFADWRVLIAAVGFSIPAVSVGGQAFVQRFFFGGQTKRISRKLIENLRWDTVAAPYRLRQLLGTARRWLTLTPPQDSFIPQIHGWSQTVNKWLAFGATVIAMLAPAMLGWWLTGHGPIAHLPWTFYVVPLVVFTCYMIACAVFELVSAWRSVLIDLEVMKG